MDENLWVGFPTPTQEQVEHDAVFLTRAIVKWKRENDHPGASWTVGTAQSYNSDQIDRLFASEHPATALSTFILGAPKAAAQELAEYHGMRLERETAAGDATIYAYTDRFPTRAEKRRRPKEVLSVKQKRVYIAIKRYLSQHGVGPTKVELARIMGHRSTTTTNGFLKILEEKNWIIQEDRPLPQVELT